MLIGIVTFSIICAPSFNPSGFSFGDAPQFSSSLGLKYDLKFGYYASGTGKSDYVDYPGYNPKLNLRAMSCEGAAGACLSSLSWYLVWLTRPWEHYEPFSLMFFETVAGAPLSAMAGTVFMGKLFHQNGSPWKSWVIGILGGVLGSLFAGNILILGGPDPDYSILGLYVVTGTAVGAVIGYNSIKEEY